MTANEALAIAVQHHQEGRLQAAEQIYRQILAVEPSHVAALHLLGVIARQVGKPEIAVNYIQHAIRLKPDFAEAHYNLGNALTDQGKVGDAAACYRRATELKPDYADAHNNLGHALKNQDKLDEAMACYRRALEVNPDLAITHYNLGNALTDQGKLDEAVACFRRATELKPDYVDAHNNLGHALKNQGRLDEAIACYRRALELNPSLAMAHSNLGAACWEAGQRSEAINCYLQAVRLNPGFGEAHRSLGGALYEARRLQEASACLEQALRLLPNDAESHRLLGETYRRQRRFPEAIASFQKADRLRPNNGATLSALFSLVQHMCDWEHLDVLSQSLVDAIEKNASQGNQEAFPEPFVLLVLPTPTTAAQQQQCAVRWTNQILRRANQGISRLDSPRLRSEGPGIRVGYLSADFHEHATAYLIAELFEQHDRKRVSVYGYSTGPDDGSPMRKRLVKSCDQFVDLRDATFAESVHRIESDRIDILVDLKGHTPNARTEILALRPAPIQVNYLGYPGTMGAPFIDYLLVDNYVVPHDQQRYFTEQLVHLPGCYQVNDSRRAISPCVPSRVECHLPDAGFVFCCFNSSHKITSKVFDVWMQLLTAVPGSVLWLLESNAFAPANLRKQAEARGVAAERLVFAERMPLADHLARHRLADLFLDTFPYNAHTTASDALWAGCPLVTISGETFASRVAGSLLRSLGLPELITASLAEYHDLALRLSTDEDLLTALRARLRNNRNSSPLFDGAKFARNLEMAYATMWDLYIAGEKPHPFAVDPA